MAKKLITDLTILNEHLRSYGAKSRNNFKWLEHMADYYDYGFGYNQEYIDNLELNSNLFKGRGIGQNDIHKWLRKGAGSTVDMSYTSVPHHDIIGNIAKLAVGIQRDRPLKPVVIDTGPLEGNERRSKHLDLIQQYIASTVLPKYQEQATMAVFQKYGIQNPMDLSPDDQQQVQFEIQQTLDEITPERIDDYMRKDYISPRSKQLSELLEVLIEEYDLKFVTDENFKTAIYSGLEVYYQGIRGGQLVLEACNPKGIMYGDYDSCNWVQDAMWVKYTDKLPVVEILKRYGDEIGGSDENKIKKATTSKQSIEELQNARLVGLMGDDSELSDIDLRTMKGQWEYHTIKEKYGVNVAANVLDVKHIVFQSLDTAKFVTRMVNGRKRGFYTGRDYEINKLKGDIEVKDIKVPMVFEVTKIETGSDPIYVNKGQVPYTYRSIENPFKVTLPYIGAKYNKLMGNGDMVSQIDLGKQGQYKYNMTYAKMEEEESNDFGKILSLVLSLKPSNYSVEEWLKMIKQDKLLVIGEENTAHGNLDPNALQAFRHIDLSTIDKVASKLQQLEAIRIDTARAMGFNQAMLGQASPYQTNQVNQSSISLGSNQTKDTYILHDKIVEKLLTNFLQTGLIYYKDKPLKRSWVMSDMSRATLELNPNLTHASEVGVFLSTSIADMQETEEMKRDFHALLQADRLTPEDYALIKTASSMSELLNISRQISSKRSKELQKQQQAVEAANQKQREFEVQMKQMELQGQMQRDRVNNDAKIQMASINADQNARAFDINQDNINDANERLDKELKYKREKDREDRRIKLMELAVKETIEKTKAKANKS